MRSASILLLLVLLAGCATGGSGVSVPEPGLNVATAALRGGSPRVALQVVNDILSKHPGDEAALTLQGDALTTLGQYDAAADSYTKVLKRNPTSVGAHIGMGRLRLATNPSAAEGLFLEALQFDPRNTTALNDLGIARDLLGNHAGAQKAYGQALGIDPDLHAAQVNLALSLAMSGDSDQAQKLLQPLASEPGASRKLRQDLAAVLAMGGNRAEAARILSADLSPSEVQQALADYVAARSGAPPLPPAMPTGSGAPPMPLSPAAAMPAVAPPAGAAGVQVQFTAAPTEEAAQLEWQRLKEHMPNLLAGREPLFIQARVDGHSFWRLRTGGFGREADAQAFCGRVRVAGGACIVTAGATPAG